MDGPDHFAARRARWLAPNTAPPRCAPTPSEARLRRLLAHPDPHKDPVWSRGIDKAWSGLASGKTLKHPLPMSIVIQVIHAAWRRDPDTWPRDAVVPDSDEPRSDN